MIEVRKKIDDILTQALATDIDKGRAGVAIYVEQLYALFTAQIAEAVKKEIESIKAELEKMIKDSPFITLLLTTAWTTFWQTLEAGE